MSGITKNRVHQYDEIIAQDIGRIKNKTLTDSLETNAYGVSNVFHVEVLDEPADMSTGNPVAQDDQDSICIKFTGRILDREGVQSPHSTIPHPNQMGKCFQSNRDQVLNAHTIFISSVNYVNNGPRPTVGDICKVELQPGQFSYNLEQCLFDSITVSSPSVPPPTQTIVNSRKVMEEKQREMKPLGELPPADSSDSEWYVGIVGKEYKNAASFIDRMKDSGHFKGFSDQFLAGLAANAIAESALGRAKNDKRIEWVVGDRITNKHSARSKKRSLEGWCSHGYWQMNVCPPWAEGSLFADDLGLNIETIEGKKKFAESIVDENILFPWIATRMKSIPEINNVITSEDKDAAYESGRVITKYFEKPAGCGKNQKCSKSLERGSRARKIYERYKNK